MNSHISSNRRIAKNTLLLYIRMLLILGVNLFTVRVVIRTLGIVDYGIFNVVSGVVTSFTFLSHTTASATQRFLSYSLGQSNDSAYRAYFKNSFILFLYISIISFLLLEIVGLWFLYNKLVIPSVRMDAAVWVFHSALLTLILSFISVPYNAVIQSHEKMDIFAYISIFDVFTKLGIVYLLVIIPHDKLKMYALLYTLIGIINFVLYRLYANRIQKGLIVSLHYDKSVIRELLGFTGWNLFGATSGLIRGQGLNILINIFFGPVFNTARGIAYQVYNAVNGFSSNFMLAVNPQIIKLYAVNNREQLGRLVCRSSKMAFSLLTIVSFPVIVFIPEILSIWIGNVPVVTSLFVRLVLLNMLVESISSPLLVLAQATGKLRAYQSVVGSLLILNLPFSWIAYRFLHADAYVCFVIMIVVNFVALVFRLIILNRTASLKSGEFFKAVISRWWALMFLCYVCYAIGLDLNLLQRIFFVCVVTILIIPLFLYRVILDKEERKQLVCFIKSKIR